MVNIGNHAQGYTWDSILFPYEPESQLFLPLFKYCDIDVSATIFEHSYNIDISIILIFSFPIHVILSSFPLRVKSDSLSAGRDALRTKGNMTFIEI